MNKLRTFLLFTGFLGIVTGCQSVKKTASVPTGPNLGTNYAADAVLAVAWFQRAGEYRALCYQAYNIATERMLAAADKKKDGDKPLAVVLDIDETVLNNSPYQAKLILTDAKYESSTFTNWTGLAAAAPIPGASEFLKSAVAHGVELFYISDRGIKEGAATIRNLERVGFPMADSDHVLLKDTQGKGPRRDAVAKKFKIIELIGDDLNDFTELFEKTTISERSGKTDQSRDSFGQQFIILPNPMYGGWENALYEYSRNLSPEERAALRRQNLSGY